MITPIPIVTKKFLSVSLCQESRGTAMLTALERL